MTSHASSSVGLRNGNAESGMQSMYSDGKVINHDGCKGSHPARCEEVLSSKDTVQSLNRVLPLTGQDTIPRSANPADEDSTSDQHGSVFQRHVQRFQEAVYRFLERHRLRIKTSLIIVFIVLYVVYFSCAMYHSFGDEASVRLLWVTCLVVVIVAASTVQRHCSRHTHMFNKFIKQTPPVLRYIDNNKQLVNWIVLCFLYALLLIFLIVDVCLVSRNPRNLISLIGIFVYLLLLYVFSTCPAKVNWRTVLWGISLQFIFAIIVLRWSAGYAAINWLGERVSEFLAYTDTGSKFVFGERYSNHMFAFQLLPVVIFFSSVVSILFYLGVMQYVIRKVAWVMQTTMQTTAAESMTAASNIFLGQSEAPLLVKPLLPLMTRSEIHAVMTGGYATIAGSVMAAYIHYGVPANHLLSASVMSAPAALAVSKLFYPETEKSRTTAVDVQTIETGQEVNVIEAASSGAINGLSLVANIAANLIAFLALLEFINTTMTWFGQRVGIQQLTFQIICSYVLWPFAAAMGVDLVDCRKVAQLIGTKTFLNEFVAYQELGLFIGNNALFNSHVTNNGTWYYRGDDVILTSPSGNDTVLISGILSERSVVISTYTLCGFSNFGSIGVQIGSLTALAPSRRADIAAIAVRAMIAGNIACFLTACIAGLFFQGM